MLKFLNLRALPDRSALSGLTLAFSVLFFGTLSVSAQVGSAYSFSTASSTYAAISGGTNVDAIEANDAVSGDLPIGFTFPYDGATYTTFRASSNGWMSLGSTAANNQVTNNLNSGIAGAGAQGRPFLAPLWDDLDGRGGIFDIGRGVAKHQTTGTAPNRVLTMEWLQWEWDASMGNTDFTVSFQVRLYEATGVVEFAYRQESTAPTGTRSASVGISSVATGSGNFLSLNGTGGAPTASSVTETTNLTTRPASNQIYRFTPTCTPSVIVTPSSSTSCAGGSSVLTASGAATYSWAPATGLSATIGASVTANPGTTTTYTVTGLNGGCPFASTTTVTVTVIPAPTVPNITPSSATTCSGGGQSLTASSTSSGTVNSAFNSTGGPATVTTGAAQNASIYPWNLTISGLPVSGVTVGSVTINGITHAFSDDLDILLQSATGTNVVLMSDIGGGNAISAVAYTFATGSPALADATVNPTGTYAPTNIGASDDYPTAPGPGNGFSQGSPTLTSFTGNFNGTWKLLIRDDGNGDAGSIISWSITFVVPATVSYTWTPNVALSATTGATVTASPASTQTYTVTASHNANGCTNSGSVTITTVTLPNAGSNNTLTICSNDAAVDMGALLGTHDAGTWNGPSTVTTDLYDPATMAPGNYVYTVAAAPCPNATATIAVTENTAVSWYADTDNDGFGSGATTGLACSAPNLGDVSNNTDLCPTDATKQAPGQCGCGNPDTDTDSDGTADCNDLCPLDANKIAPGICGCGVSDVDTDTDGTADCIDGCPNDINKIAPGICGCGLSDVDTDTDGTADCIDGCPNDINKIAPGICGCGVSDVDTDLDGTADCNDGCPNDLNKIAPGQCGCGVADTDTDSDGTADCNDLCPLDANKIAPGQCGCGVADTDTDSDGTADCNDLCPLDANKIAPGICGCGVSDVDTDTDGTADCLDGCPADINKIAPGICGCGVSDVDTDTDGTADCNDGCPNDINKIAPGICGCGVADTDTDSDGTADCNDLCPIDPLKVAPGQCGCGVADTDTDSDGTADCNDLCPLDANKIAPGQCGCGVADTDTDSDGTADCNDLCPLDANKIAPGICGCGVSDVDTDLDGTADCNDGCPLDVNKIAPGICGCGVSDVDTDLDGTADCNDGCPLDVNKTTPGQCGCGNPDTDTDLDGTADCVDGCPSDPDKIAPGICGCDTPDDDTDGDGLADCVDPCPNDVNNSDTDSDGTPDCNDNCPFDANKVNPGTCGCGVADTDTDGDTYADCVDGCPADANKITPGACGCGVADTDTDGDGTLNCNDGCPNDANKVAPGVCGCGTPDTDTDSDTVPDCNDNCPNLAGQIGDACNDGNPNTVNDMITGACICAGTANTTLVGLTLATDNDGASTSWDIVPMISGPAVCSGSGYSNNSVQTLNCTLPDGCYRLRVFDANMDGMCCMNGNGGYVLSTSDGKRIIDANGAGIFSSTAEVSLGFCVPLGSDKLTPSRCDRENYLPSDFIQATPNAAVQAQYGNGVQSDDGYQFWIFNPNGGYSRRVFLSHATSNYLFPVGADRCSYLLLSSLVTSPLPFNVLLNVRVRCMVNGVYSEFGSACRMRIDLTNQCPTTQLNPTAGPLLSCGKTGILLNGSTTLHASVVSAANKYQFEFTKPGYLRKIAVPTSSLVLTVWGTLPLAYNSTYDVRVRVSFDGGLNYCPFGPVCQISTAATPSVQGREMESTVAEANTGMRVWPNPNRGEDLHLMLEGFGENTTPVTVVVTDLFGKQVYAETIIVEGEVLNTTIDLSGKAAGMYLVNVSSNNLNWSERVIVQ